MAELSQLVIELAYNIKTTQVQGQEGITMAHELPHPKAGELVTIQFVKQDGKLPTEPVQGRLEDWWDRLTGQSWMYAIGNPAALNYAARSGLADMTMDDEVVYVKINNLGHLAHVSELVA